jgi:hypothetical protein
MSSTFWQRSGITPGKAALVGVLAVCLIGVVGYQIFSGAYGTRPSPPQQQNATQTKFEPKRRGETTSNVRTFSSLETEALPVEAWPKIPLDETLAHNPFATPEVLIPEAPKTDDDLIPFAQVNPQEADEHLPVDPEEIRTHRERVRAIRDLMTMGASMVMTNGDGSRVAVVNSRTIRIGDTIHGMRVTEITSEGVVLEAISTDQ